MLPCGWYATFLCLSFLLLILVATFILTNHGKAKKLGLFILTVTTIPCISFLISAMVREKRLKLYLLLLSIGLFFVIISALVFSFYFETIEIFVGSRGTRIGATGWSLVGGCVVLLIVIKIVITKLREHENVPIGITC